MLTRILSIALTASLMLSATLTHAQTGTVIECEHIPLGDHITETQSHQSEFVPLLIELLDVVRGVTKSTKKITDVAHNCSSENCGGQCGCSGQECVRANVCADIPVACSCGTRNVCVADADGNSICKDVTTCTGGSATQTVSRDVTCQEGTQTVPLTVDITATRPCTETGTESVYACSPFVPVPDCGSRCCHSQDYIVQEDRPDGVTEHLDCQNPSTCQPQSCTGKGIGASGSPCGEGIVEGIQEVEKEIKDYDELFQQLKVLKASLEELRSTNETIDQQFSAWVRQTEGRGELYGCYEAQTAGLCNRVVTDQSSCPHGGNDYYVPRL